MQKLIFALISVKIRSYSGTPNLISEIFAQENNFAPNAAAVSRFKNVGAGMWTLA